VRIVHQLCESCFLLRLNYCSSCIMTPLFDFMGDLMTSVSVQRTSYPYRHFVFTRHTSSCSANQRLNFSIVGLQRSSMTFLTRSFESFRLSIAD